MPHQRSVHDLKALILSFHSLVAQGIITDGKLTVDDIDAITRCKGGIIARGGVLEFFPAEENRFELGGFAKLEVWLDSARIGFTREGRP
jgi:hypothetical protein